MFRAYALILRTIYLSAAAIAPLVLLSHLVRMKRPWEIPAHELIPYCATVMIGILLYGALPANAWLRFARREGLLPDQYLRARPLMSTLVALLAALGTLFAVSWIYAVLYVDPVYREGNSIAPYLVTLLFYALALPIGELVLLRRLPAAAS